MSLETSFNQGVLGSIPRRLTTFSPYFCQFLNHQRRVTDAGHPALRRPAHEAPRLVFAMKDASFTSDQIVVDTDQLGPVTYCRAIQ